MERFAACEGAGRERQNAGGATTTAHGGRRYTGLLALDAGVLSALIVLLSLEFGRLRDALATALNIAPRLAGAMVLATTIAAALPLVIGIGRLSRGFGGMLAETALPKATGKADMDAAPRRALGVTLQLGIALATGIVVVAVTQIFLPGYSGPLVLFLILTGFSVAIWRSVRDLEGHVRAGAQAVVSALGCYARAGTPPPGAEALADVTRLLPGLGEPVAVRLESTSGAVGQSLAELNLRGRSGATVLAISRNGEDIVVPTAEERLQAGDVLALTGSHEAIDTARDLLH